MFQITQVSDKNRSTLDFFFFNLTEDFNTFLKNPTIVLTVSVSSIALPFPKDTVEKSNSSSMLYMVQNLKMLNFSITQM